MDANGLRFWLLADDRHWRSRSHVSWDAECKVLRLASERVLPPPADPAAAFAAANAAVDRVPRALDASGCVATWDAAANAVVVRSALPGEAILLALGETPTDLIVGFDGVLYCALPSGIHMHDLRGRWDDVVVNAAGFVPWRLAADPAGGAWVLERASGRIARLTGSPLPLGPYVDYAGTVFRPDPENCHEARLRILADPAWPAGERPLALAFQPDTGLALLSWLGDGAAQLRSYDTHAQRLQPALQLVGARYAYGFDWLGAAHIVVRIPGRRDAPAYDLSSADEARRVATSGEVYPLASDALEAPFAHRVSGPPAYPVILAEGVRGAEPLYRLSISNLVRQGEARNFAGTDVQLVDSGSLQTVWHRLYAEAQVPARTGFVVWLAATAELQPPDPAEVGQWLPHYFGDPDLTREPQAPIAAWEHAPSELPSHPGLGPWTYEPGRAGLLSVLIQDARKQVRNLVGRYLWVRVSLHGDGRTGPQIAALRAYACRFSYRDQYLPRLYRESVFGAPAESPGERLAALDAEAASILDAGGVLAPELVSELRDAGLPVGELANVTVQDSGQSWLLRDPQGARAWRLRSEDGGIGVYRPQATPADFLERMLDNFEGVLTPLEDRIAAAHLLSDPLAVPEASLDWLAGWTGVAFDPALPESRRRAWLTAAPWLARLHGTKLGLQIALDIASGGGVRGGEIIVLENFRLRRILATLLGVDLNDENDPLLPGLVVSGNSVVGDTLTLGEQASVELLALFRAEVASAAENADVLAFLDELANRATVLVHQSVTPQDVGLLRRVVELESPAHVATEVLTATWPFMVGVASLVGVDSYLGPPQLPRPARANVSSLGQDFVLGPVALDPRLGGAAAPAPPVPPPVADAGDDFVAAFGNSFSLDATRSRAAEGHSLASFIWRLLPQI
ncbi:phage tail protein [Niveibacterium sp. SC-1]|uniref:phage tail protein n=1 Tax=Niveibacterium sp. SC-1 TaxID=3135646 RepID=UPI00311DB5C8